MMPTSEKVLPLDRMRLKPRRIHGKYIALNLVPNQKLTMTSLFSWHHTYSTDKIIGSISSCEIRLKVSRSAQATSFAKRLPVNWRKCRWWRSTASWISAERSSRPGCSWSGHSPTGSSSCRGSSSSKGSETRSLDWVGSRKRTSPASISENRMSIKFGRWLGRAAAHLHLTWNLFVMKYGDKWSHWPCSIPKRARRLNAAVNVSQYFVKNGIFLYQTDISVILRLIVQTILMKISDIYFVKLGNALDFWNNLDFSSLCFLQYKEIMMTFKIRTIELWQELSLFEVFIHFMTCT